MVLLLDIDLTTSLSKVRLKTPVIIAGGVINEKILLKALDFEVGAITIGTVAASPKSFHQPPYIVRVDEVGFVNAYGIRKTLRDLEDFIFEVKSRAEENDVRLICSVIKESESLVEEMVRRACELGCDVIELNLSTPVISSLLEKGLNISLAEKIVYKAVKASSKPVSVKLSPLIQDIAAACRELVDAGAGILHLINALSPALAVDVETGRPKLNTKLGLGALTGTAIKPIALAKVLQAAVVLPETPIIGTGGVTTWRDAVEMIVVCASAVGVHSLIYSRGLKALNEIVYGIKSFMERKEHSSISEFKGSTLKYVLES